MLYPAELRDHAGFLHPPAKISTGLPRGRCRRGRLRQPNGVLVAGKVSSGLHGCSREPSSQARNRRQTSDTNFAEAGTTLPRIRRAVPALPRPSSTPHRDHGPSALRTTFRNYSCSFPPCPPDTRIERALALHPLARQVDVTAVSHDRPTLAHGGSAHFVRFQAHRIQQDGRRSRRSARCRRRQLPQRWAA